MKTNISSLFCAASVSAGVLFTSAAAKAEDSANSNGVFNDTAQADENSGTGATANGGSKSKSPTKGLGTPALRPTQLQSSSSLKTPSRGLMSEEEWRRTFYSRQPR
jgi:hypothetical protein